MANAKAAFILPTSGSGVNGPSLTATWNAATYQSPMQASIAEIEAAHIGGAAVSTTFAQLSSLGLTSDNITREYKLKNPDTSIDLRVASSASPGTSYFTIKPGETVNIPWVRVKDLYIASASGTPRVEWIGC